MNQPNTSLFIEHLTTIDFSYIDEQRGIVGESLWVNIHLQGELDHQSMVCDFSEVKKRTKQWLDQTIDHTLVLPMLSEHVSLTQAEGTLQLTANLDQGDVFIEAPKQAFTQIPAHSICNKTLTEWATTTIGNLFPELQLKISLQPESTNGAYYHYSHGLRKHAGNCQRIVHGHRSKIEIYREHQRAFDLEESWALKYKDSYLASQEDLKEELVIDGRLNYRFAYQSSQGAFSIRLPASMCQLIDADTTVEQIAKHIHEEITHSHSETSIRVRAFEGIGKGAEVGV